MHSRVGAQTYPFRYSDDERPDLVNALARQYPSDDLDRVDRRAS